MNNSFLTRLAAALSIIIVFVIDYHIPPGTAIGVLYLTSITIVFNQKKRVILFCSLVSTFLILLNVYLFKDIIHDNSVYYDRLLSIFGIWASCLIALRYRSLSERHNNYKKKRIEMVEEMLFITNHKVRQSISQIQGLNILLDHQGSSEQELKEISILLKQPVQDLDDFTRELTRFMIEKEIITQPKPEPQKSGCF
ncbi:hypothetical protein RM553_04640 [Zunongwangia sp. F363]|uniref:Histidine kinase n=1 Tax=Autumnicola tepida TaxID=3075595 RepID=A0ABU3C6Z4_9FLAO|nr:hypothetical protein [Zunongwangia sp. F363]MDT0642113.1 hypothetical protein [Zunongwangia sp. F363]